MLRYFLRAARSIHVLLVRKHQQRNILLQSWRWSLQARQENALPHSTGAHNSSKGSRNLPAVGHQQAFRGALQWKAQAASCPRYQQRRSHPVGTASLCTGVLGQIMSMSKAQSATVVGEQRRMMYLCASVVVAPVWPQTILATDILCKAPIE